MVTVEPRAWPWAGWQKPLGEIVVIATALIAYGFAYSSAWQIPFRVEEFDIYHFYATTDFNPFSAFDWGQMAFWTPFYDFRMLPLAYLWNFGVFELLGTSLVAHWLLSIALDLLNACLLAHWVSFRLGRKRYSGWIAAAFFLLLPAKHEIVLWSFLSYKLVNMSLVLGTLICFERYFHYRRDRNLAGGLVLMFLSWFFYEASLPLGLALPLGMLLFGGFSRRTALRVAGAVAIPYCLYGILFWVAQAKVPSLYGLILPTDSSYIGSLSIENLWLSLRNWVTHGMLLANSGLPIQTDTQSIPTSIAMQVMTSSGWLVVVITIWAFFAYQIRWRSVPGRSVLYALGVGALLNVLVLGGRTATNGVDYLAHFSMYQYLPSMILAALLGGATEMTFRASPTQSSTHVPSRRLVAATVICVALLGFSSVAAARAYLEAQKPLIDVLNDVEERCSIPETRISVVDTILPFSPDAFMLPPETHAYSALSLLNGDCILRPSPHEQSSAVLREEPLDIPHRAYARFADHVDFVGFGMPPRVQRGGTFQMTLYFKVKRQFKEYYRVFVHFDGPRSRFTKIHFPITGSYNPYVPGDPLHWGSPHWQVDDYVRDVFQVKAGDETTPPGRYTVWFGWFPDLRRGRFDHLEVIEGDFDSANRVRLGTIEVVDPG